MTMITLAQLKSRLALPEADVQDDALLQTLVDAIVPRFERAANRAFARVVDAQFEFAADRTEVVPDRLPVESVLSFEVKSSEATGWVPAVADYLLRKATVISLQSPLGDASEQARVTYTGGYAADSFPADLVFSALDQCAYWYQNKNRLGITSLSAEGGSLQQFAQLDLLPSVKAVLTKYERFEN